MIKDYILVRHSDPATLEFEVKKKLRAGYQPKGAPLVVQDPDNKRNILVQNMIKVSGLDPKEMDRDKLLSHLIFHHPEPLIVQGS